MLQVNIMGEVLGGPMVGSLSLPKMQVQYLVMELRSQEPRNAAKKKKNV